MNCNQARKQIDVYVDGELDMRQRTDFDAHLAACLDCSEHVARVQRIRVLSQSFDAETPEGLRERVAREIRHQTPTAMDRIKEKLVMKSRLRMGVGVASVVAVAALGTTLVLAPRQAVASSAVKVFESMKRAAKTVRAVHQMSEGKMADGTPWRVEIWTDGDNLWVNRSGFREIIYKGKFYYDPKPAEEQPQDGKIYAVGQIDPDIYTLTNLLFALGRDENQPMDLGFVSFRGQQVHLIGINELGTHNRHIFYVPLGSDLPMRSVVQTRVNGTWADVELVDYEFVDKLSPALFKNLPPQVKTREATAEDKAKLIETLRSKKG